MCFRWKNVPLISPDQVRTWLNGLPPTCENFDGAGKIMLWLFRLVGHSSMCPVVRYYYPLEDTYHTNVLPTLFGWTYYGSADPDPSDPSANCQAHKAHNGTDDNVQQSLNYTCLGLGICYLFLEVFIIILLLGILLTNMWDGFYKFYQLLFYFYEVIVMDGFEIIGLTFKVLFLL